MLLVMFEWRHISGSSVFDKYIEIFFFSPPLMGESIKETLLWKRQNFKRSLEHRKKTNKQTINAFVFLDGIILKQHRFDFEKTQILNSP